MSCAFSIAIPTYNNGHRLERLIATLRQQEGIDDIEWEILIVDNNSTDGSRGIIKALVSDSSPSRSPRLRSVCESNQGAAFARIRAMKECSSEYVAFIDDDIAPAPNWIRAGYDTIRAQPQTAVLAGKTLLPPSLRPFPNFKDVARLFAIEDHGDEAMTYSPHKMNLPPSAAVWVRRQAWLDCVKEPPFLKGYSPGFPFGGDDYEAFYQIALAGWQLNYDPSLFAYHELNPSRFEKPSLKRLARAIGHATYPPRLLSSKGKLDACWIALRMIARGITLYIRQIRSYGWRNQTQAAYMKRQHSIGYMCSPFMYALFRLRSQSPHQ